MAEEFLMVHPSGKHAPVPVYSASRRDTFLARGYTLIEQGEPPEPKPQKGQKRRTAKDEE